MSSWNDVVEQSPQEENPPLVYTASDLAQRSFKVLHRFYQQGILCDVRLVAEDTTYSCHRVVLASCSPYFQAMFTSPLRERNENEICIQDISAESLGQIVEFAYSSQVSLTEKNVQALLHAASVLQIDTLEYSCCQYIKDRMLSARNCLSIWQFASAHGLHGLSQSAEKYALRHWQEVTSQETDDFLALEASVLEQLLQSSDLCVDTEMEVYESAMCWLKHSNRLDDPRLVSRILSKVRMPLLAPSFLKNTVKTEMQSNLECRDLLDEAKDYQLWKASILPGSLPNINERIQPRKSYAGLLFCVGGRNSTGEPMDLLEFYSLLHDRWFRGAEMRTKRRHVGCCALNGKIYAVGGCDHLSRHLASGEIYLPAVNVWKTMAAMRTPRRGLGLCSLSTQDYSGASTTSPLYAVGGLDDSNFYNTVERYDVRGDFWSTVTPMKTPRGGVAVANIHGSIYAFGGNVGQTSLSTVEKYDPQLDRWVYAAPMKQRRAGAAAVVGPLDHHVYIIGGFDNNKTLSSVERYDVRRETWSTVSDLESARGGVGGAALSNDIYAIGGHSGANYLDSVEIYDQRMDRWRSGVSLGGGSRAGAGVVHCNGSPIQLYQRNKHNNLEILDDLENLELV